MGMKNKTFKKIIVFFSIFALFFSLGSAVRVCAAEPTGENQAVEQQEETITIEMKVYEFLNKWLTPTVSGLLGLAGSFLGYFLYKRKYHLVEDALTSGVLKTEKSRELANKELEFAKEQLDRSKTMFDEEKEHYVALIEQGKEQIEQFKQLQLENRTFKEILACIIASTPELAKNGYTRKLLLLLEEGDKMYQNTKESVENITAIITEDEKAGVSDGANNN